jgi:hypothetical protein
MSGILTPGYLRWDGTKYVLDNDIEIVGPPGSQGPSGPAGPAGPPGPFGSASGDILGNYPGPISVVGLTGIFGVVNFGTAITSPTIGQAATAGTTGATMTLKAQAAALFGGNIAIQSGTGTTAGLIQFLVGNSTAAFFDANQTFRIGPSAASTTAGPNGTSPLSGTDYIYGNNATGSMLAEMFTESSSQRAGYTAYNAAAGGTGVSGISIQAPGTTYTVSAYQGQGVIEQSGLATSAMVLSKVLGDGTSRAVTGRIFQSGAWGIGDTGSSSTTNQAGLSGSLLNFSSVSGSVTTTGGQGIVYKTFAGGADQGTMVIQGNTGVNLISATTSVANTTTTKFITSVGRRIKVRTTTTTPDTMTAADEVLSIGAIATPFTVNLPATPTSGDTYIVKDALGNAGNFNITVSGNGSNIDGFATIVISTNYTEAMFVYNGTSWLSALTNNISPNTGYSSVVNVASGGTANVVGLDELLLCDPTSNTCTITAPATPIVNLRFTVKDATAKSNVHAIIVNGNGRTLEDPQNPGVYTTPVNIVTAALSATWAYDPTRNRFTVV